MKSSKSSALFTPRWQVAANVGALQSTRCGGASESPYDSFNLGNHVGDEPKKVGVNRATLNNFLPASAHFVQQVHGTHIHTVREGECTEHIQADGLFTNTSHRPLAIMTADCLPVLLASDDGTEIAALHCGWRSLAGGIIERAVPLFNAKPQSISAWLGPAIGPLAFEVGAEVNAQFIALDKRHGDAFTATGDKFLADLPLIATQKLHSLGVVSVSHQQECTYSQGDKYFSYRRDGQTGRMATVIWRKY